jgi:uncharacterized protein involved in type VI secretion and phage assembly
MASPFDIFMQKLTDWGLEYFHRYYGLYRAEVKKVDDPEERGRIQVQCPEVGHTKVLPKWVEPSFMAAGKNRGWFWPPEVGDSVWVSFERGDAGRPNLYFGGWFGDKEVPTELGYAGKNPKRRGFATRTGHTVVFNEEAGKESIEVYWRRPSSQPADKDTDKRDGDKASFVFDKEGSILLTNKNGTSLALNAKDKKITIEDKDNSNTVVIDSNGVKITTSKDVIIADAANCKINAKQVTLADGADTPAVRGDDLKQWLSQHTHPSAVGPTGPPVQSGTLAPTLSTVVKLK